MRFDTKSSVTLGESEEKLAWFEDDGLYLTKPFCNHTPKLVLPAKNGGGVWAASERGLPNESPEGFDLFLNFTGYTVYPGIEKIVKWENYEAPKIPAAFWRKFWDWIDKGNKALVYCMGSHGRTGTALSCLVVASEGVGAKEAIEKIRKLHCARAVESKRQKNYVKKVAGELNNPKKAAHCAVTQV